jgi:hypothetical protein
MRPPRIEAKTFMSWRRDRHRAGGAGSYDKGIQHAARKDIPFDATKLDSKCTEGITPKKSNWSNPIDQPPFWAFSITEASPLPSAG